MIKIAPSILAADFANLERDVRLLEASGADMLHIDVMDGHFVPNITIGHPVVKSLRQVSNMFFDAHLMIERPENYIEAFAQSGANLITVHAEATHHLHRLIQMIKQSGAKAGVSLNPATPVCVLENILQDLDLVLIMSVNPGFGGQKFIESAYGKIKAVRKMLDAAGSKADIQVDGGIGLDNIKKVVEAGANVIVAGSAIFNSKDVPGTIKAMKQACEGI